MNRNVFENTIICSIQYTYTPASFSFRFTNKYPIVRIKFELSIVSNSQLPTVSFVQIGFFTNSFIQIVFYRQSHIISYLDSFRTDSFLQGVSYSFLEIVSYKQFSTYSFIKIVFVQRVFYRQFSTDSFLQFSRDSFLQIVYYRQFPTYSFIKIVFVQRVS